MNKEQLAALLNGRQYGDEITESEQALADENGLLVCFGASDDLLELRGIVYDEVGAYDGGVAFLVKKKNGIIGVIGQDDLEEVKEIMDNIGLDFELNQVEIIAEWCPEDLDCSWRIKTELPHATFDIMEDGDLYCRGIVIEKSSIEQALS
jgi:hypothetical protein